MALKIIDDLLHCSMKKKHEPEQFYKAFFFAFYVSEFD